MSPSLTIPQRALCSALLAVTFVLGGSQPAQATYGGGNGRLLLDTNKGCGADCYAIRSVDPEGSGERTVVDSSDMSGRLPALPSVNRKGNKVAFIAGNGSTNSAEIFVIRMDGRGLKRLTRNSVVDRHPSWGPGGMIYFERNQHLYRMRADGSHQQKLLDKYATDPEVSRDGTRILFTSSCGRCKRPGCPQIYSVAIDGSHRKLLTNSYRANSRPSWSPDSRRIIFSRGSRGAIMSMKRNGKGEKVIRDKGYLDAPVFSPDGKKVAAIQGFGQPAIVMRADGTNLRELDARASFRISWQPI